MRDLIIRSGLLLFAIATIGWGLTTNLASITHSSNGMNSLAAGQAVSQFIGAAVPAHAYTAADPSPLLDKWEGPFGGVPPFDRVQIALFKPALEAAMAENLSEVEAIATNPAAPNFDNTIAAMERAGRTLDRVQTVYGVWSSTMNGLEFQVVQREMAPRLAAFNDTINQNAALFRRIEAVNKSPEKARLTTEQQRLIWFYYTNFVRTGESDALAVKLTLSTGEPIVIQERESDKGYRLGREPDRG